jgi:hypothetical protein
VDEMRCKSDRETSGKTDEKTCPEHNATLSEQPRIEIMVHCGGNIAAHCGASRSCDFVTRGTVVSIPQREGSGAFSVDQARGQPRLY